MEWKFAGDLPVYQQIITTIQGAVLSGELGPGNRVPPVRELAALARVNPNTMQRALVELERQGLLVSAGTSGRFVTDDEDVLSKLRIERLAELAAQCVRQFAVYGVSAREAAALIEKMEE